jgi:bacteriocin biosynthesis cyclodehydratase domain-containing protein
VPTDASPDARLRQTVLRPGVHVLRRSSTEIQVGLDPERAVVLPDRPAVRGLLDSLASPAATPEGEHDRAALTALADSDLLVDADTLLPLAPTGVPGERHGISRGGLAALGCLAGDQAGVLAGRRAAGVVDVVSCGDRGAGLVADRVVDLLDGAGAGARGLTHGTVPDPADSPAVGLLVSVGEPPREHLDGWVRSQVPHLVLRFCEGHVLIGPFVLPGETACLRCVDAHHTDADAAWPLLVAQHAAASARGRADGLPEPLDPVLATLAAAWAVREVLSHLEGVPPAVSSGTLRLDPRATSLSSQVWMRHPCCGCGWG